MEKDYIGSAPMDSEQKAHALKILGYNDNPGLNTVMNTVTDGEINIATMIKEIQAETSEGFRFLEEVLCAEENTELDLEV